MKALHLKILLSHCFSSFFPFHKLQLSSYIGKFLYIYVIDIKVNKKTQPVFFQLLPTPAFLAFHGIFDPLFMKTTYLFGT